LNTYLAVAAGEL